MSVFSKIFIVINLLLTLLLVAATATQINLKGVYQKNYRDNHAEWVKVREELAKTKSDYQAQVSKLRAQASQRKEQLQEANEKLNKAKSREQGKLTTNKDLAGNKSKLNGEIRSLESQGKSKASEIRAMRDSLDKARKERERLWKRILGLTYTYFDLEQELLDAEAWRDSPKKDD